MLKTWRDKHISNMRLQLKVVKEVVYRLELARDRRPIAGYEESLHQRLKLKSLDLSSLQRSIARQESMLLWLSEGDSPTKFLHYRVMACRRKNHIHSLLHEGNVLVVEDSKAEVAYSFFNEILGTPLVRSCAINLEHLDLPSLDLTCLSECFTNSEVWVVMRALPPDKALGPDGFMMHFLQSAWPIIQGVIMCVIYTFWRMDSSNLHDLKGALMVLILKASDAAGIKDHRPIALIHVIGKLIAKVLANRLAPRLNDRVHCSQSAFIKSRCIQDNFWFVQGSALLLHAKKLPCLLLKIDIVCGFDLVA
jgi:hypothetical protein